MDAFVDALRQSTSRAVSNESQAVLSGSLLKRSDHTRSWRERHVELQPAVAGLKAKLTWDARPYGGDRFGSIPIDSACGVRCASGQLIVRTPQRTLRFQASSGSDLDEWRTAMLSCGARPTALLGTLGRKAR